jgi:hypothetical protein
VSQDPDGTSLSILSKAEKDGRTDYDNFARERYSERLLAILTKKSRQGIGAPGGFSSLTF